MSSAQLDFNLLPYALAGGVTALAIMKWQQASQQGVWEYRLASKSIGKAAPQRRRYVGVEPGTFGDFVGAALPMSTPTALANRHGFAGGKFVGSQSTRLGGSMLGAFLPHKRIPELRHPRTAEFTDTPDAFAPMPASSTDIVMPPPSPEMDIAPATSSQVVMPSPPAAPVAPRPLPAPTPFVTPAPAPTPAVAPTPLPVAPMPEPVIETLPVAPPAPVIETLPVAPPAPVIETLPVAPPAAAETVADPALPVAPAPLSARLYRPVGAVYIETRNGQIIQPRI